jgi:dihydroxy-acid dehydratase
MVTPSPRRANKLPAETWLKDEHANEAVDGTYGAKSEKRLLRSHLPKLAGTITIHTIDEIGRKTPLLVDLKPSGNNYMTDSHNSGMKF